jgi:hypothetical protein
MGMLVENQQIAQRAAALALGWVIFGFQPKNITQYYTTLHHLAQFSTQVSFQMKFLRNEKTK